MRLASRAIASLAVALGLLPLVLALSRHPGPLSASIGMRQQPSQATTPQASTAPNYKSKFVGVCWHRAAKKWEAQIVIEGKPQHLGLFGNEEDAARAFDERAAPLGRPVNFPGHDQAPAVKQGAHGIVSQYTGMCWNIGNKKWNAYITEDGKRVSLGYYGDEDDAARAYDERAGPLGRPVNFPLEEGQEQAEKRGKSKYEGVHWNFYKKVWEALGVKHGERVSLGSFKTEEEAARAVDDHLVAALGLPRKHFPKEGELRLASAEKASQFVGVYRVPKSKRWCAKTSIEGKTTNLGTFGSEEEAARAFDERAAPLGKPVNFPKEGQEQAVKRGSSKYRGVTKAGKKWRAQINIDGKYGNLGTFGSEEAAARKFDEAAAPLGRKVNFSLSMDPGAAPVV